MKLTWLADEFRRAGLRVAEESGWEDRGAHWRTGRPFGAIQHHTAAPVPFNVRALTTPLIKCNFNVKPDGTVHVIAAGSCNFSSGSGSQVVLDEVRKDISPPGTAKERGLLENVGGNPLFINNETDHLGKGQPIPDVQYDAVIKCWVVIFTRMGWHPNRLIAHGEWRSRKPDPAWNAKNSHANMEDMRADLAVALAGGQRSVRRSTTITKEDDTMLPIHFTDGFNEPTGQGRTRKRDDVKVLQAMLGFTDDDIDGRYGKETVAKVKAMVGGNGKTVDGKAYIRIQEQYLQSFLRSSDNG
jgi:hypothetical protein